MTIWTLINSSDATGLSCIAIQTNTCARCLLPATQDYMDVGTGGVNAIDGYFIKTLLETFHYA